MIKKQQNALFPQEKKRHKKENRLYKGGFLYGGENRIRTCEAVTPTRFPVVRLKPNSAISPKLRNVDYYTKDHGKKQALF